MKKRVAIFIIIVSLCLILATTLLINNSPPPPPSYELKGNLEVSAIDIGNDTIVFEIHLENPKMADVNSCVIRLIDRNNTEIKNFSYEFIGISSDMIETGDFLSINNRSAYVGYKVIFCVLGYSGFMEAEIE